MSEQNAKPLEVTSKNIGDVLTAALNEAVAYCGQGTARAVSDVATYEESSPPTYDAPHIRAIRTTMALSQEMFARLLNVSIQTVQAWERGTRPPGEPSLRLLELAEKHPEVLRETAFTEG